MAYCINGGRALSGEVSAQGSKNAALPILFACMAVRGRVLLSHLPAISDIEKTKALLSEFGAVFESTEEGLLVDTSHIHPAVASPSHTGATRASSYLLGVGLGCFGEVRLSPSGGCNLGKRPLDIHKGALEALGALWQEEEGSIHLYASRLSGRRVRLPYRSVGATVNLLLAALFAEGRTDIYNYAREGHIRELLRFLRAVGAEVAETPTRLTVWGKRPLHSAAFRVSGDEIEAATYLMGGVATGGRVRVSGISPEGLFPLLHTLGKMGVKVETEKDAVAVLARGRLYGTDVVCRPHPGFPTDLHPQMSVLLALSETGGSVRDTVFPDRFGYADALAKMGGAYRRRGGTIRLFPSVLRGAAVAAPDLRAGAALTIAALAAEGRTLLEGEAFIGRGYESFAEKWQSLGGDITLLPSAPPSP